MGDDNLFKKTGRKSAKEQLEEIGAGIVGLFTEEDEKPAGYTRVIDPNPIKERAKKVVKSRKTYTKQTKKKTTPRKQVSASAKGTKFFDFFEG